MIRRATREDASRLAEILIFAKRTTYRPIFRDDVVSFQGMQVLELALNYRDGEDALKDVYVYDDGIVKGMMSWDCSEDASGRRQLRELYIDPFFQNCGVGSALMTDFLSRARGQGMTSAFLWVLEKNENARKFYHGFGFEPDGEKKFQPGTDQRLLRYKKTWQGGRLS